VALALLSNAAKSAPIDIDPDQWLHASAGERSASTPLPQENMG
jgi:hypothetical protein